MQTFKLIPFPAAKLPAIEITGTIARQGNLLSVLYCVQGEIEEIFLLTLAGSPARRHELWRSTCFEFFFATQGRLPYWEFNMSPSGDWNIYVMDAYRQVNMREETAFTQLPFSFQKTGKQLSLDISVNLDPILRVEQTIQAGITTIIQTLDGNETYWALKHPGQQADFHLRESFVREL